jgi:AhpD family alkylhydroperoxidase
MTIDTKRQAILDQVKQVFGFVPKVIDELSYSPAAAAVYLGGNQVLRDSVLSEAEKQAAILVVSTWNDCNYCTAAHRTIAMMQGISQDDLDRITRREAPVDERLQAVTTATWRLLDKRGWLGAGDVQELEALGIDRARLYEIVAIIGLKTITNYVNHIAGTEIDEAFKEQDTRAAAGA